MSNPASYYLPAFMAPQVTQFIPPYATPAPDSSSQISQASPVTAQSEQADKAWYPDSGTTKHFAHGPPAGTYTQPYLGSGNVQVTDGTSLEINNIGTSVINTSVKPLVLHNMLYTPQVTKNIVYVSQFTKDNQVFV